MGKLSTVASLIWSTNKKDTLVSLEKQLDAYIAILNPKSQSIQPHNKLIVKQRPFHSTKRKRKTTHVRIAKPSQCERKQILQQLQGTGDYQIQIIPEEILCKFGT